MVASVSSVYSWRRTLEMMQLSTVTEKASKRSIVDLSTIAVIRYSSQILRNWINHSSSSGETMKQTSDCLGSGCWCCWVSGLHFLKVARGQAAKCWLNQNDCISKPGALRQNTFYKWYIDGVAFITAAAVASATLTRRSDVTARVSNSSWQDSVRTEQNTVMNSAQIMQSSQLMIHV